MDKIAKNMEEIFTKRRSLFLIKNKDKISVEKKKNSNYKYRSYKRINIIAE